MQYLTMWRMQFARKLLTESALGTATVAERVGYQSEAAFS
jgi:transcriptional regulator GlxA family with amidase domain